jgi:hypothetical protein
VGRLFTRQRRVVYNVEIMVLGLASKTKTADDVLAELDELIAILVVTRAELSNNPASINLRCRAAALDTEIEQLVIAALLTRKILRKNDGLQGRERLQRNP